MNRLIAYLRENIILDFRGELTTAMLEDFLGQDESDMAHAILAHLMGTPRLDDMLSELADRLLEGLKSSLTDERLVGLLCDVVSTEA